MRKNPRRILSPQRLPFRHPGKWQYKLNELRDAAQYAACHRFEFEHFEHEPFSFALNCSGDAHYS